MPARLPRLRASRVYGQVRLAFCNPSPFIIGADITDSAYRIAGAHQVWRDETSGTHNLTFSGLRSDTIGGALYISDELTMEDFKGLEFSGNAAQSGGAFCGYAGSGASISGNGSVSFIGNSAAKYGGAIYGYNTGAVTISGNGAVEFRHNSAAVQGGAIHAAGTLNVTDNGSVTFRGNHETAGRPDAQEPHPHRKQLHLRG